MIELLEAQVWLDGDKKKHVNNILYKLDTETNIVTPIKRLKPDYDGFNQSNEASFKICKTWMNNRTRETKITTKEIKCIKEYKGNMIAYRIMYQKHMLGFATSDIEYSEKAVIEMFLNNGFLFRK